MHMHHNYVIIRINVFKSSMWHGEKLCENLIHCNLLPVITKCLPLNIILEKRRDFSNLFGVLLIVTI